MSEPVQTPSRASEVAGEAAATLASAGVREAAVLQTAGRREAAVLQTAGQRRVNLLWEATQSIVAILVVSVTLTVAALAAREGMKTNTVQAVATLNSAMTMLSNSLFLVIGFYFGRTNHTRTGGVGASESPRGE